MQSIYNILNDYGSISNLITRTEIWLNWILAISMFAWHQIKTSCFIIQKGKSSLLTDGLYSIWLYLDKKPSFEAEIPYYLWFDTFPIKGKCMAKYCNVVPFWILKKTFCRIRFYITCVPKCFKLVRNLYNSDVTPEGNYERLKGSYSAGKKSFH